MNLIRYVVAILLVGLALYTFATPTADAKDDLFLSTTLGSYHFDRPNDYCETNPGVGIKYFIDDNLAIQGGAYKNSPCRTAVYVLGSIETNKNNFLGVGLAGGFVSGYTRDDFATAPIAGYPYVRIGKASGRVHANIVTIPHSDGLLGFMLQWKLN